MSTRGRASSIVNAAREYSTAAVMLHAAVGERVGLSPTDLKALDLLQRMGPQSAGSIAAETGLATASVTSLIDRLEGRRFVRRARDPADGRRVVVALTRAFDDTIGPLFASLGRKMAERCRAYSDEEAALLREFLSGCAADMRRETTRLKA